MFAEVNAQPFILIGGGIYRNQCNDIFMFQAAQCGDIHVDKRREFVFNKPRDKQWQRHMSYVSAFATERFFYIFCNAGAGIFHYNDRHPQAVRMTDQSSRGGRLFE